MIAWLFTLTNTVLRATRDSYISRYTAARFQRTVKSRFNWDLNKCKTTKNNTFIEIKPKTKIRSFVWQENLTVIL